MDDILNLFSNTPILVVGDIILDEYVYGNIIKLSQESSATILNKTNSQLYLGGAANVAANIASLGGNSYLIGIIGNDNSGNDVKSLCIKNNIKLHISEKIYVDVTIHKTRYLNNNNQLLRVDNEKEYFWKENIFNDLINSLPEIPKCVIISDYNKGTITPEICSFIKLYCKNNNIPLLIDPKPRKNMTDLYFGCNLLKPNKHEAEEMSGISIKTEDDIYIAGKLLVEKYSSNVLITLAEKGMQLFTLTGESYRYSTKSSNILCSIGAGDSVLSTLGLCISNNVSIENACKIANVAGQIVATTPGTSTLTIEDIKHNSKIFKDIDSFKRKLDKIRKTSKIVMINGCFDILHVGHLDLINKAREYGDYCIIALNSDHSIKLLKGNSKPINNWEYRSSMLASMSIVDAIIPIEGESPIDLFYLLQPDYVLHGDEGGILPLRGVLEDKAIQSYGGKKIYIKKNIPLSTTLILNKAK